MARKNLIFANHGIPGRGNQRLVRTYSADHSICIVTFWLPREAVAQAQSVVVTGTFNNWDQNSYPMKKLDNGDFALDVAMESGKEHEFRFIIDKTRWENAWNADKYVRSALGDCENSVIVT